MTVSVSIPVCSARRSWCLAVTQLLVALLCLICADSFAAPADAPVDHSITVLIERLGKDHAADAQTLARLRPLVARSRITGPDRARLENMPEDAWLGSLETLWIDKHDGQGRIAAEFSQRILHSQGEALRVYALQGELEKITDGEPVIITGYRVGNRVLVTGVSQPPPESVP